MISGRYTWIYIRSPPKGTSICLIYLLLSNSVMFPIFYIGRISVWWFHWLTDSNSCLFSKDLGPTILFPCVGTGCFQLQSFFVLLRMHNSTSFGYDEYSIDASKLLRKNPCLLYCFVQYRRNICEPGKYLKESVASAKIASSNRKDTHIFDFDFSDSASWPLV